VQGGRQSVQVLHGSAIRIEGFGIGKIIGQAYEAIGQFFGIHCGLLLVACPTVPISPKKKRLTHSQTNIVKKKLSNGLGECFIESAVHFLQCMMQNI
jgi:hypothetical protein